MSKMHNEKQEQQMVAILMEIMYNYKGMEGIKEIAEWEHMVNFNCISSLLYEYKLENNKMVMSSEDKANFKLKEEYDVIATAIANPLIKAFGELFHDSFKIPMVKAIEVVGDNFNELTGGSVEFHKQLIDNTGDIILEVIDKEYGSTVYFAYFQKVHESREIVNPIVDTKEHLDNLLKDKEPDELIHFLEFLIEQMKLEPTVPQSKVVSLEKLLGALRELI